ncbi:uncharacterized protein N7483_009313 [Penicillium malachiteum]|uniref:uncharacterized protein n=1 Tax=Penicillium malachiteum TaxID=1324776 RepID=UPI0025492B6A|nr:uncharacterized protein N7483_009313 [Penicillium malachiteum]KAJ5721379.1 hypothetical protein N7483_009313 [Penicillium malachiteum]
MSNNQECASAVQWPQVHFQDQETQYDLLNEMVDVQMLQQSFVCDPLGFSNDPDAWAFENQMNFGSPLGLPKDYDQQWQLWNQANLVNPEGDEGLFMTRFLNNNGDIQTMQHPDEAQKQQGFSRLAAERALFMTPLTQATSTSTFPGSPLSDLSSTTEFSHITYNQWEVDRDRDEFRSPISDSMSDVHSGTQNRSGPSWSTTCHPLTTDNDYPAVLEMPDGSTRRNSNWLPVDPNAGFTIGSCSYSDGRNPKECFAPEDIHDIQDAFISHGSAQWMYDG